MIRPLDIRPDHLEIVKSILREHLAPEVQVWIFGSRADWLTKDSSDLDIALEGKRELSQELLGILKSSFEDSALPFSVDVVDLNRVGEPFRRVVETQRIPLPIGGNGVRRNVNKKGVSTRSDNNSDAPLPTLPSGWREVTLGELTDNFDAIRVPVKESGRRSGPFPYYGASGVVDHVDGFLFDGQYLLIAEDGENLRTRSTPIAFLATGKFWVNNHAHIVRGNGTADTRFLNYALSHRDISGYLTGSTMPKLTQGNLNRIPLLAPPLDQQRAIAHVLGALDDKIELNRRMNETLEGMARALFTSWFVDFEPVRAKMDGRWRRGESLPGLPAEHFDLFPDRLVPSQLGNIPEGWKVKPLGELAHQLRGSENPLASPDSTFLHFSIPAFDEGRNPRSELGSDIKSTKSQVPPGTVLLSKLNPEVERVWIVDVNGDDRAICSTEFLVLQPREPYSREFVYCHARSQPFRSQIESLVTGTSKSHQRAPAKAILSLSTVVPPRAVVEAFSFQAYPWMQSILAANRESRDLATQRDALLPRLVSGEVRV